MICTASPADPLSINGWEPFVHLSYLAKQSVFSKYPWLELRGILRHLAPATGFMIGVGWHENVRLQLVPLRDPLTSTPKLNNNSRHRAYGLRWQKIHAERKKTKETHFSPSRRRTLCIFFVKRFR